MGLNRWVFALVLSLVTFSGPLLAAECKDLPKWLNLREVAFRVIEPTETYDVKVELPEVAQLKCTASPFEYGTDYLFSLKKSDPVKLSYFKKGEDKASRTVEMAGELGAQAVLLAAEREKTPHFYAVTDEELESEYRIYLSKNAGPAYVQRKGSDRKFKILSYK